MANRAGVLDVDVMLAGMTPEEFDERVAAERLDDERTERFAQIFKLGFAAMAWGKVDPDVFDPLSPEKVADRMRRMQFAANDDPAPTAATSATAAPQSQAVSPNQAAALFASVMGPPTKG